MARTAFWVSDKRETSKAECEVGRETAASCGRQGLINTRQQVLTSREACL